MVLMPFYLLTIIVRSAMFYYFVTSTTFRHNVDRNRDFSDLPLPKEFVISFTFEHIDLVGRYTFRAELNNFKFVIILVCGGGWV